MNILSVFDESFRPYGKVLQGYDTAELVRAMEAIPLPESGTAYKPGIDSLEACALYGEMQLGAYGGMPIQLGMCWGHNTCLNCLEYHRDSEVNIGDVDFILLLAKQDEIVDGVLDTDRVKAFKVPAGVPVEVYATTLHYAPCSAKKGQGFKVNEEDRWMTACNKWLLAHPDSKEAKNGAHIGLRGVNINIKEDL